MMQRIFCMEIALFQNIGAWIGVIIVGLLIGVVVRFLAVRRQKDFRDAIGAVLLMWALIHACNIVVYPPGTIYTPITAMSLVAILSPVCTFMIIGFLVTHLVVKLKNNL